MKRVFCVERVHPGKSQNDSKKQERPTHVWRWFQPDWSIGKSLFSSKMALWHCAQAIRRFGGCLEGILRSQKVLKCFSNLHRQLLI
jgi:hypothetical protein